MDYIEQDWKSPGNFFHQQSQLPVAERAGTISHDLDPFGLLEKKGDKDINVKGTTSLIAA